ncbi:hypothetical protein MTO96_039694 [Rhipicephalus appendiculatus]
MQKTAIKVESRVASHVKASLEAQVKTSLAVGSREIWQPGIWYSRRDCSSLDTKQVTLLAVCDGTFSEADTLVPIPGV